MKKYLIYAAVALVMPWLTSCSQDYTAVVPANSSAVISIDLPALAENNHLEKADKQSALKQLLHVDNVEDCGIDVTVPVYAFETIDGQLGMVASVSDDDDLEDWLNNLVKSGDCKPLKQKRDFKFTVLHDDFMVGFSSTALLIMGPVVGSAQGELQRQMIRYLKADDDEGIKNSKIFDTLDSISGPVAMVAQAQALPEKLIAPFTLGAPKGTSPTDILVAASMEVKNGCLVVTGENFSLNKQIDQSLKQAAKEYRPITAKYLPSLPANSLISIVCGIDGEKYIKQLRTNDAFRTLLAGVNQALDIDMMLKSINGDMVITVPSMKGDKMDFQLVADAKNKNWMGDVGYWKTSCPKGTKIEDWIKDGYHLTGSDWNTYFGVSPKNRLYICSSPEVAMKAGEPVKQPLSANIRQQMLGKRMVAVVDIESLAKQKTELKAVNTLLKPIFGDVKAIIYSIK
jgi:hypothetical protein